MRFSESLQRRFRDLTTPTGINFLAGTYDQYDGWMTTEHDTHYFEEDACFAIWEDRWYDLYEDMDFNDDSITGYGYYHRVNHLELPKGTVKVWRQGWDDVINKVWQLLPSFSELLSHDEFEMDGSPQFSMREVNFNFRMIRCFHEQPDYVTSCAWLRHHLPGYPAPVIAALAATQMAGPTWWCGYARGDPHTNLSAGNSFQSMYRLLRCLTYMESNDGILWGAKWGKERQLMGIDAELFSNASGRWPSLTPVDSQVARQITPGVKKIPMDQSLERLHEVAPQALDVYERCRHLEVGDTLELDYADYLITEDEYQLQLRKEMKPW
jgi:hypothetical protein